MGHPNHIFVDQPVDENLICMICLDVCDNATTACSAGHTFCESCLGRLNKKECPACRSDCLNNVPNRPLRSMIDALQVRCCVLLDDDNGGSSDGKKRRTGGGSGDSTKGDSNPDDSCSWVGVLGDLKKHKEVCAFVKVRCPLDCHKRFRRMDLKQHIEEECIFRKVECKMCNDKFPQSRLKSHQASYCPKALVKCKYCDEEMDRESLGEKGWRPLEPFPDTIRKSDTAYENMCTGHYLKCSKLVLCCEFYKRGCKAKFTRDTAAVHHAENVQYHAALVDRTFSRLNDELGYDYVNITWPINCSKILGEERKVLESSTVSGLSPYELYLKLYLNEPDDAIKIAICSKSISVMPMSHLVELKRVNICVTDADDNDKFAEIKKNKEYSVTEAGNRGVFEHSTVVKVFEGDDELEDDDKLVENEKDDCTRSGLIQAMNHVANDHIDRTFLEVKACFRIRKVEKVQVQCVD